MGNQNRHAGWLFAIGLATLVSAKFMLHDSIRNRGIFYQESNPTIQAAMLLLLISAVAIYATGWMLANRLGAEYALARAVIHAASGLASVCLLGIAWLWSMVPNMQRNLYVSLPNRGVGPAEHQVIVTLEGSATYLGVVIMLLGVVCVSFLLASEFTGQHNLLAKVVGVGSVGVVLIGSAIGVHAVEPNLWLHTAVLIVGIGFAIVIAADQIPTSHDQREASSGHGW